MGFFKKDYNKPGPGVPKNAPRKKGFARFLEIVGRDAGNLVKLNLLFFACCLPSLLLFLLSLLTFGQDGFLFWALLAWILSFAVGPAITAVYYLITKMLRDDPGFIWHDFKRIFKSNFKGTVLPGMFYTLILGSQALSFFYYYRIGSTGGLSFVVFAIYLFSVLLFAMAAPYFFLQKAYLDLKNGGVLKNSLLLALANAPRSLMGALLGSGLILAQMLFLPLTFITLVIFGFSLPMLLNMMWIWPPVDKVFSIEKTLRKRENPEQEDEEPEPEPQEAPQEKETEAEEQEQSALESES